MTQRYFYFGQEWQGKYHEALRDNNRAIALNPDNANSYYNRALTYRAIGDFAAAQEDFGRSCALGGSCQPPQGWSHPPLHGTNQIIR